jgi:hypothetical protein
MMHKLTTTVVLSVALYPTLQKEKCWNKKKERGVGIESVDEPKSNKKNQNQKTTNPNRANRCILKVAEIPKYKMNSNKIGQYIQHIRDHAIIDKFKGI